MASVEQLKETVFARVAECRRRLKEGVANFSGIEDGVRAFCQAVAALPRDEGRAHTQDLESLGREVTALGEELTLARDIVKNEIAALSRVKQANVAYHKSDAMGPGYRPRPEDDR